MKQQQAPLNAKVVLGVAAHPDDLDFAAGGTIAHLANNGARVTYLILTDGSKGSPDANSDKHKLTETRHHEQETAARALGVDDVIFLNYTDGELENTAKVRGDIVRHIRRIKPDTVITMDPSMLYAPEIGFINHPDHRAAGQATIDAVYPYSRNAQSYPELAKEGLQPHNVTTLLLANFTDHNYCVDIGNTLEQKLDALEAHASQTTSLNKARPMLKEMALQAGRAIGCETAEPFIRIDITA